MQTYNLAGGELEQLLVIQEWGMEEVMMLGDNNQYAWELPKKTHKIVINVGINDI